MRMRPLAWKRTLASLGFFPNRSSCRRFATRIISRRNRRKLRIEALESRSLLAADFTVTTLVDEFNLGNQQLSLREALHLATTDGSTTDGDIIDFDLTLFQGGVHKTLTLSYDDSVEAGQVPDALAITSNLTIQGPGAELLSISGGDQTRVFNVLTGVTATIADVRIADGNATESGATTGGGIRSAGNLTVKGSVIEGNTSTLEGGGIHGSGGTLSVESTVIRGNSAGGVGGGGIWYQYGSSLTIQGTEIADNLASKGGGVAVYYAQDFLMQGSTVAGNHASTSAGGVWVMDSEAEISNSTISENRSDGLGPGGVWLQSSVVPAAAILTNLTIAGNQSGSIYYAGGLQKDSPINATLHNSIIAGNGDASGPNDIKGSFNSLSSYNLIGYDTVAGNGIDHDPSGKHNQVGGEAEAPAIDARLAPLANYGGEVRTHALLQGSSALDAGSDAAAAAAGLTADQRGRNRAVSVNLALDDYVDIGAYEQSLIVSTASDATDGNDYSFGHLSLRESLALAASLPGKNEIEFDSSTWGETIVLSSTGQLLVNSDVSILGPGKDLLTIDAHDASRIFAVWNASSTITAYIRGMTVKRGFTTVEAGGVYNSENLTLEDVAILDCNATTSGGGVFSDIGFLRVIDCTVAGNSAMWGGAMWVRSANAVDGIRVTGSTFNDNHAIKGYSGGSWIAGSGTGGGITLGATVASAPIVVTNTTVSSNTAEHQGGGLVSPYYSLATITVVNATIAYNSADNSVGGILKGGAGGSLVLHNTIAAENTAGDFGGVAPMSASSAHSLFGFGTSTAGSNHIVLAQGQSAGLLPLDDYGGPTPTHALDRDSFAIDQGGVAKALEYGLRLDQRGFGRTVDLSDSNGPGGATDVGAMEFGIYASLDAEGELTIDDEETRFHEITLTLGTVAAASRLFINGLPTPYRPDEITAFTVLGTDNITGDNGDDVINLRDISAFFFPNLQSVTIDGRTGDDTIDGTSEGDRIISRGGNSVLNGGAGDDVFVIAPGYLYRLDDWGGEGRDILDLSDWNRPSGISIDLEIVGEAQALDVDTSITLGQIGGVDGVIGTNYDDEIYGNSDSNIVLGMGGNDSIYGRDGNDYLDGGEGEDTLFGGSGDDDIRSEDDEEDDVHGGDGKDRFELDGADRSPPEIVTPATIEMRKDQSRRIRIAAMDADSVFGDWEYELFIPEGESQLPAGVSIGTTDGILTITSSAELFEPRGAERVGVKVTDPDGLEDSQVFEFDEYDSNEQPPRLATYFANARFDDGPWFGVASWQTDWPGWGPYNHVIAVEADDTTSPWGYESTSLEIVLNSESGYAGDTQTPNEQLQYELLSGPGDLNGNVYSWTMDYHDAPMTHIVEVLITDAGTVDDGATRSRKETFYINVSQIGADSETGVYDIASPTAVNGSFWTPVGTAFEARLDSIGGFQDFPEFEVGSPSAGTLTMLDASTGAFRWEPPTADFQGVVTFEYEIEHSPNYAPLGTGRITSNTAVVKLYVGPYAEVDISTDVPEEDEDEAPGKRIVWNRDDDNQNGVADYLEIDGNIEGEDDLVPLSIDLFLRDGLSPQDFFGKFSGGVSIWDSPTKGREIIVNDAIRFEDLPATVWLEATSDNATTVSLQLLPGPGAQSPGPGGSVGDSIVINIGGGLTAYRPTPELGTIDLGTRVVSDADEDDPERGPGIRVNFDDDDGNGIYDASVEQGPSLTENDLIRIDVARAGLSQDFVLEIGQGLALWSSPNKNAGAPIVLDSNRRTGDLGFVGDESVLSFWAEWIDYDHGTADITLIDLTEPEGENVHDVLEFHTFQSLVIALSGETFSGTVLGAAPIIGGINDPREQGTAGMVLDLIDAGFDVQFFDNQSVDRLGFYYGGGRGAPYDLVIESVSERHVQKFGIFGYSHGGGATYALSWALNAYAAEDAPGLPIVIDATAYVDAVTFQNYLLWPPALIPVSGTYNWFAEQRRPLLSGAHANWYQSNGGFHGTRVRGSAVESNLTEATVESAEMAHDLIDDFVESEGYLASFMKNNMSSR